MSEKKTSPRNGAATEENIARDQDEKIFGDTGQDPAATGENPFVMDEKLKTLLEWAKRKLEEERQKEEEQRRQEAIMRLQLFFPGIEIPEDYKVEDIEKVARAIEEFTKSCGYTPPRRPSERETRILESIKENLKYYAIAVALAIGGIIGYLLR